MDYEFDDDRSRIDVDEVWQFLSRHAYWGRWRSRDDVQRQVAGAWRVVGCYTDGRLVGFCRAVSDGVGLAYLADVFVLSQHRGQGLGRALAQVMVDDGPGRDFRWLLHTADAHGLYEQLGFAPAGRTLLERPHVSARRVPDDLSPQIAGPPSGALSGAHVAGPRGGSPGWPVETAPVTPAELVRLAREVQRLPYRWPAAPDAASTEAAGAGTCAGKHALLAQRLEAAGLRCAPLLVVGTLAPQLWPDLADDADGLLEVHECLTVLTPWSGPLTVDVTWHPAAVDAGLPGLREGWDGRSDTDTAVASTGPGYAVGGSEFRAAKEALRDRLYDQEDRRRRDRVLHEIAVRAAAL